MPEPAASISTATVMANRGNVSFVGRPRPTGSPVARSAGHHPQHPGGCSRNADEPVKSPASNVDSMPTMRAPKARPGGSPIAAAMAIKRGRPRTVGQQGRGRRS